MVGGCAWQGACVAGGHAWQGACMAGGYVWQRGVCVAEGHAWQMLRDTVNERAVHILLECIFVCYVIRIIYLFKEYHLFVSRTSNSICALGIEIHFSSLGTSLCLILVLCGCVTFTLVIKIKNSILNVIIKYFMQLTYNFNPRFSIII